MGTLTGFNFPSGICSDKAGDVYIINGSGTTVEAFAHGGTTPLRTLSLPGYPEFDCLVDAKSGDFAIGTFDGSCGGCAGYIAVFKGGQGIPTLYQPADQSGISGCAYDPNGNLFCDAYGPSNDNFLLYELPAGSETFENIAVNDSSLKAGTMQWDGKYLVMGSSEVGTIAQTQVSGSSGSVVGMTTLDNTGWVWQFWLVSAQKGAQCKRIVAPNVDGSLDDVGYWNYPTGGTATTTIDGFSEPDGVAISTAAT